MAIDPNLLGLGHPDITSQLSGVHTDRTLEFDANDENTRVEEIGPADPNTPQMADQEAQLTTEPQEMDMTHQSANLVILQVPAAVEMITPMSRMH